MKIQQRMVKKQFKESAKEFQHLDRKDWVLKQRKRALRRIILKIPFKFDKYMHDETFDVLGAWTIAQPTAKYRRLKKGHKPEKINTSVWNLQKRLRRVRRRIKSKQFSTKLRRPWETKLWEKTKEPTRKENVLFALANRYQNLRFKDRFDFFRSHIGQMLLTAAEHGFWLKDSWLPRGSVWNKYNANESQDIRQARVLFAKIQQKSWWYESLVQRRISKERSKRFVVDRPQTAFQLYWKQRRKETWKEILLFRRSLYAGFGELARKENKERRFEMKTYLRRKNPRREKKNQLYRKLNSLLPLFKPKYRILATKHARIRQIARKVVWPFYGHLRTKQMLKIHKKSSRRKSQVLTRHETILSHLESRLDVVVYRLNMAPSILWARRLIQTGAIFITSVNTTTPWEKMHASLKKMAFPLKLRDPKKLYRNTLWTGTKKHWATFRFLSCPQTKISYLVQPGEIVQCWNGNSWHQFKTKEQLFNKPIPKNLLTRQNETFFFEKPLQQMTLRNFKPWEEPVEPVHTAVFLHTSKFKDLMQPDRIQESFLRWTLL